MIESMTGFGKAIAQLPTKKITVEIKSLNSKGIEINARIPSNYREKELDIRRLLSEKLVRGKVDFGLYIETTGADDSIRINKLMVQKYMDELRSLSPGTQDHLLEIAMRLPESVSSSREDIDLEEWDLIIKTIDKAVVNIQLYRSEEGMALKRDLELRIGNISNALTQIITLDASRKEEMKTKLRKAVDELKVEVDENRFEQELIYYLEKLDITEEIVRLKNHLEYFIQDLNQVESNGKKMGFISQEMGREINTIGSKANHAPMQKLVIQMKDELEKIKEQSLNVL
ncbi:MAG: YicC family protein [Flavobacteriaceae bacterium]|nr:YicC family protein [Flavobacteriaceae bacterium]